MPPPRRPMARGALVRLQARDGSRTSDKLPSLACRASASITGCVRKTLLRLRPSAYLTRDHRLGAALSPPRPLSPRPLPSHNNAAKVPRLMSLFLVRFSTKVKWKARQKCRALLSFPFVRFPTTINKERGKFAAMETSQSGFGRELSPRILRAPVAHGKAEATLEEGL